MSDELLSTVQYYYDANSQKPPNNGRNWLRVLIAFGAVQDSELTAYTAFEAVQSEKVWAGWRPVREALQCIKQGGN